tara:strand:- start:767 stop:1498 length:732 start_codon:yes stop_codon:yes gene_type:complete
MIFPSLTLETIIQLEDKTRLDASLSFISGGGAETITDVLIQPETSETFITVFNTDNERWFLDWAYATEGEKTVIVKVITDVDLVGRTRSYTVDAISKEDDGLFSDDADLYPYEPNIISDVPNGKNSYLYAHRKAQDKIIAYLDEQRIWHDDGSRYTKQELALIAVTDSEILKQFNMWSTFETLLIIFESNQVSTNDVFQEKKSEYEAQRNSARSRSALRLDANKDGAIDPQPYDIRSLRMIRR